MEVEINFGQISIKFNKRLTTVNDFKELDLGNQTINRLSCTKFLVIHINEDLEWSCNHIDHVVKKMSSV